MLNFHEIIPRAASNAGDRPIVAAPYALGVPLCRALYNEGVISGYVAESRPGDDSRDPLLAGWWVDRPNGIWFLRNSRSSTLVLLGGSKGRDIDGQMLLEARLKGIRRVLLVASDGSITREIDVASALLGRLTLKSTSDPIHRLSYEDMFEDMYRLIGDRFRLPLAAFGIDRIMLMTGSLAPGGAERQAAYTAAELARRFPGKVYLNRTYDGPTNDFFKPSVEAAGVQLLTLPASSPEFEEPDILEMRSELQLKYGALEPAGIFFYLFHHALRIRAVRPGLVHTWQDFSNILSGIAAQWVGVPRIVLAGRSVAPDHFSIFQPYMKVGYRCLLKSSNIAFLNNSAAGAEDYARWLNVPPSIFRVVHNGFEFPNSSRKRVVSSRRELGFSEVAVVVGSILRFSEEKRPKLWLEMARLINAAHPRVRFVVYGQGPLLEFCRAFVQDNKLGGVIQLPGLTDDMWSALSAMDIFVLTSRMEGLPNVMIEAQGIGVPVVCTPAGGMREAFVDGETGIAAQDETAESLAQAVGELIVDSARRRKMGANAERFAREKFSAKSMVNKTLDAYRSVAKREETLEPKRSDFESKQIGIRLAGILNESGSCYKAKWLPHVGESRLELWEDYRRLGSSDATREEVIELGAGRYALIGQECYFSASDNSDPRFNGRSYYLRPITDSELIHLTPLSSSDILCEIGYCYIAILKQEGVGHLELWEDDRILGPGGCMHDDIRQAGGGCYSLWGEHLYFSTSDNSNPRVNGRAYTLRRGRAVAGPSLMNPDTRQLTLDDAMRHLTRHALPRGDYVQGRVVHVGGSLGPGGAERQILYTLRRLLKLPFESAQLLCSYLGGNEQRDFYLPAFREAGIPVRTMRQLVSRNELQLMPGPLRDVAQLFPAELAADIANLYSEFEELRPEIVHAWLDGNNIRAGLAAALAGVPRIVLSGRNVNPSHFALYESSMDAAYRALVDLPQVRMLNNSVSGRDDYARWLGLQPDFISVIHNGCEFPTGSLGQLGSAERSKLGIAHDAIVIGTISRFSEEKRPQLFVETARRLLQHDPQLQFVLFGVGPMHEQILNYVTSEDLSQNVRLPGVTYDSWASLAAMDIFLLTSRMEGFPNVLMEAQGAGVPVVSTMVGGAPETFVDGETGIGVASSEPDMLVAAVLKLIRDPVRRKEMAQRASDFARKQFSIDRMISLTLDAYRSPVEPFLNEQETVQR